MDELIKQYLAELQAAGQPATVFTVNEAVVCLLLSFILTAFIGWIYRMNHNQISYSQSFVHTMALMGTVAALIMLVIGSNIARAFSLVGALSIIRFRSAVKEPQDVAYLFFAMAIGMACGTRFYLLATIGALMIGGCMTFLRWTDFGRTTIQHQLLEVTLPAGAAYESLFTEPFKVYLEHVALHGIDSSRGGAFQRISWIIRLRRESDARIFLDDIKTRGGNHDVSLSWDVNRQNL
jgi:hypothetical protein